MKVWLGVIGRACIEFAIILVLVSFTAAALALVSQSAEVDWTAIAREALGSAVNLAPLAALLTLFLAFFSFEARVKGRGLGWLGLLALGALLFSVGIGARRTPLVEGFAAPPRGAEAGPARLIAAGKVAQKSAEALWVGAFERGEAVDAVGVDFGADYPRMVYAPRAALDFPRAEIDIQGRTFSVAAAAPRPQALAPELEAFSGLWIWDRLAAAEREPIHIAFVLAGGFLLFALGFRFLCRLSAWPLTNALVAAAGLAGLLVLDAALSGPAVLDRIGGVSSRLGLRLEPRVILAGLEGALGAVLSAIDLALGPKRRPDE